MNFYNNLFIKIIDFEPGIYMLEQYNDILINFKERELATKIKEYEAETNSKLDENKIHFVRCDGRHFKSFCKGFTKPFDLILRNTMRRTMIHLCEEISGAFIGFTQSDEITVAFKKLNSESEIYFNGRKKKIETSVSSSCTISFNQILKDEIDKAKARRIVELIDNNSDDLFIDVKKEVEKEFSVYDNKNMKATFDARVFSMPVEECSEGIIWRMMDCYKNAIQMIARCNFTLKELHQKKTYEMKNMLADKGINLENEDIRNLYGTIAYKVEKHLNVGTDKECIRNKFVCDEPFNAVLYNYKLYGGSGILYI